MARMNAIGKPIEVAANSTANSDSTIPTTAFVQAAKNTPHPTIIATQTTSKGGVFNGDFEVLPTFVAAQTATGWIDGTAAGSATNDAYGWYMHEVVTDCEVKYDSTVCHSGTTSLKVSTTSIAGKVLIFNSTPTASLPVAKKYYVPIKSSTKYRYSAWVKTNNAAVDAVWLSSNQYDSDGATLSESILSPKLSGTNDWKYLYVDFTSNANAAYFNIILSHYVAGNIADAWFDEVKLEEIVENTGYTGTEPTALLSTITAVSSTNNIDQSKSGGDTDATSTTTYWRSQQFIPSRKYLSGVLVQLKKTGAPTGNLVISIESDSSNSPDGVLLSHYQLDVATLTTSFVEYTIPLNCILTVGAKYFIVFKRPSADGVTNFINLRYLAGTFTDYSSNGAGAWTPNNGIQYDVRTTFAQNTVGATIVCNGDKIDLTTDADGILDGVVIDLDAGKYKYNSGVLYSTIPTNAYKFANSVYSADAGLVGGGVAYTFINNWSVSTVGIYALTTKSIILKVNTVLPIKNKVMIKVLSYFTAGTFDIDATYSLDNVTYYPLYFTGTVADATLTTDTAYLTLPNESVFYLKLTAPTPTQMRLRQLTIEADIDTSAISEPIIYPLSTNQFTERIICAQPVIRITYYKNKYENCNGVVIPHFELIDSNSNYVTTIPIPIDNSNEANSSVNIVIAGTTNAQQVGTGSNYSSTGYILNDTEYMTFSSAVSLLNLTYKVGTGTTSFSNITMNKILITSDGTFYDAAKDPSNQMIVTNFYRVQSTPRYVSDVVEEINKIKSSKLYFRADGSIPFSGTQFVKSNNDTYLQLCGGSSSLGKGGIFQTYGCDHGTYPGRSIIYVPNAAKNANKPVITIDGVTDTPVIMCNSSRISSVGAPTTAGDALIYQAWAAWTPTLSWTGADPSSITTSARWIQVSKIVYFNIYINSADSNACTGLTFTLPSTPSNTGCFPIFSARQIYGAAGTTYASITFYGTQSGADNIARTNQFNTCTDGQRVQIMCQGFYEVA